jgi:hypothetical protein
VLIVNDDRGIFPNGMPSRMPRSREKRAEFDPSILSRDLQFKSGESVGGEDVKFRAHVRERPGSSSAIGIPGLRIIAFFRFRSASYLFDASESYFCDETKNSSES